MKKLFLASLMALAISFSVHAQNYPASPTDVSPMMVGEVIEDTPLFDSNGKEVSLYAIQDKPAIIVFYRGLWCSNCIKHFTQEFKDHLEEFESAGYRLMLVSADQGESLREAARQTGIDASYFYGDKNNALAKKMGLVWQQQERLKENLLKSSEGTNVDLLLPISAFYMINSKHEVRFADLRPLAIPVAKRILYDEYKPILHHYVPDAE